MSQAEAMILGFSMGDLIRPKTYPYFEKLNSQVRLYYHICDQHVMAVSSEHQGYLIDGKKRMQTENQSVFWELAEAPLYCNPQIGGKCF